MENRSPKLTQILRENSKEEGVKMRKESVQKHFPEVKTKFTQ